MRIKKFFKTIVVPAILAASVTVSCCALSACADSDNENDAQQLIQTSADELKMFMADARSGRNFTTVSIYSDGSTWVYYADDDKIKTDYKGTTTYGLIENKHIYRIYRTDDLQWHRTDDAGDLRDPEAQLTILYNKLIFMPWNEYDNEAKALVCALDDGRATAKLESEKLTVDIVLDTGVTTTFIVKDIGTTTVSIPDDIAND